MTDHTPWWATRRFIAAMIALAAVPLLWPAIPPLVDLPGHMGRYRIQTGFETSPYLSRWFDFHWGLIGNLGIDLLVFPLGALFGLEPAVKLIVVAIPMLTVAGLLLIAREIHGRVPPTALFALPLAYCYPLHFGFVNYCLAMALALLAFALWLRLGRLGRTGLRATLFVPIGMVVWLTHGFGWAMIGLLALPSGIVGERLAGRGWLRAIWRGGIACWPLAPTVLLQLLWREDGAAGKSIDFFNLKSKMSWVESILRDRWIDWDRGSAALLGILLLMGLVRFALRYEARLAAAASLCALAFLLLPRILMGSAYADMRLAPYAVAVALIALVPTSSSPRALGLWAAAGLAFFAARVAGNTASFLLYDRAYQAQLPAIGQMPMGSRVFALINIRCPSWSTPRMDHLASLAIVRRDAFVNDQWTMPGAQLIRRRYAVPRDYGGDPSQMMTPLRCRFKHESLLYPAIDHLPRDRFDFVWLVDLEPARWPRGRPWLVPVWHGAQSGILYRVTGSATAASDTPNGSERRDTQPASAPNTR